MTKNSIPSSKEEMKKRIEQEAKRRGYSFTQLKDYNFIIRSGDKEVRGNIRETGRGKVKHPGKAWVGIWGPTWKFLNELNDDSRSFIVELDYMRDNFLVIPLSQIPKECLHPYGSGQGQSFHISKNNTGYTIRVKGEVIPLTDYINNIEVLFKPLERLPPSEPKYKVGEALTHSKYGKVKVISASFKDGKWFYEVERVI